MFDRLKTFLYEDRRLLVTAVAFAIAAVVVDRVAHAIGLLH